MTFSEAVVALCENKHVRRSTWEKFPKPHGSLLTYLNPWVEVEIYELRLYYHDAQGKKQSEMAYLSKRDLLADDWEIVEREWELARRD